MRRRIDTPIFVAIKRHDFSWVRYLEFHAPNLVAVSLVDSASSQPSRQQTSFRMASEEMSTNAVVAAAPTRGISFSFAKRSQGSGSRARVESHGVGGGRDDVKEEADKDLVFSLEGGNINR